MLVRRRWTTMNPSETVRRFWICKSGGLLGCIVALADCSQRFAHVGHEPGVVAPGQLFLSLIGYGLWPLMIICAILAIYVVLEVLPDGQGTKQMSVPLALLLPIVIYGSFVLILHITEMR
jgi:hypothetical protein